MRSDDRTFIRWRYLGLIALLGGMLSSACEDDLLYRVSPQIAVDVCKDGPVTINGVLLGGTKDCRAALGQVDLADDLVKEIIIANPSSVPLEIRALSFRKGASSPFALGDDLKEIAAGQKSVVKIRFRPTTEDEVTDQLIVDSNAGNVPPDASLEIEIKGRGINNGLPDIDVSAHQCNFGRVGIGQAATCQLVVSNLGTKPLIIDKTELLKTSLVVAAGGDQDPFAFLGLPPVRGERIGAGASLTLTFRFTPDVVGEYKQNLQILTNDPDEKNKTIELVGEGVLAPIAQCHIKSVNNVAHTAAAGIEPLDNVLLSGEGSTAQAPGATIASYHWEIVKQPAGSTAWLTHANALETGFAFSDDVQGVDLAGKYEVRLVVEDSFGTKSSNQCVVKFDAIPTDSVHVQSVWDTNYGDMDLHLAKKDSQNRYCVSSLNNEGRPGPLGEKCNDSLYTECNYATCRTHHDTARPTWDADDARGTSGDPSLDIDDLSGYGPENINIDHAVMGSYLVSVHNFGGGRSSGNTLRIYLFGQLSAEFYRVLQPGEWWEAAIIHWPENMSAYPCIEDLSSLTIECPIPSV